MAENFPIEEAGLERNWPIEKLQTNGKKATKRRSMKTPSFKGSNFAYSELDSLLDLDHWDKVIDDYLGVDSETVYKLPTYYIDSDLDQSGRILASEINTQTITTSPMGTSDNPIRIESSPEKIIKTPPTETPKGNKPRPRRNPGPPKIYGERRFICQVALGAETTEIADSDDKPLITFSGSKSLQTTFSSDSPSDYLTPLEDILPHPTLVAETKQGSSSTPSSMKTKIAVLSFPLEEVRPDIQDDDGSYISSVIDIEVRKEADSFHDTFKATS